MEELAALSIEYPELENFSLEMLDCEGQESKPKYEHSRRASKTPSKISSGKALETMSRCRQTMPLLANLGFRVPQARRNGLAKFSRHRKSLSRSAETHSLACKFRIRTC